MSLNPCSRMGCCPTAIPKGLKYYQVLFHQRLNIRGSTAAAAPSVPAASRCSWTRPTSRRRPPAPTTSPRRSSSTVTHRRHSTAPVEERRRWSLTGPSGATTARKQSEAQDTRAVASTASALTQPADEATSVSATKASRATLTSLTTAKVNPLS